MEMRWLLKMRYKVAAAAAVSPATARGIGGCVRRAEGTEAGGTLGGRRAGPAGTAPSPPAITGGGGGEVRRRFGVGLAAAICGCDDSGSDGGRPGSASCAVAAAPAAA